MIVPVVPASHLISTLGANIAKASNAEPGVCQKEPLRIICCQFIKICFWILQFAKNYSKPQGKSFSNSSYLTLSLEKEV